MRPRYKTSCERKFKAFIMPTTIINNQLSFVYFKQNLWPHPPFITFCNLLCFYNHFHSVTHPLVIHAANIVTTAHQVVTGLETKEELSMQRCWCFFGNSTQLTVTRSRAATGQIFSPLLELDGNLRIRFTCHPL